MIELIVYSIISEQLNIDLDFNNIYFFYMVIYVFLIEFKMFNRYDNIIMLYYTFYTSILFFDIIYTPKNQSIYSINIDVIVFQSEVILYIIYLIS